MTNVLVIADDLTGAAEIAGIATRHGLPTRLVREKPATPLPLGLTVLDTDTRLLPPHEATRAVRGFIDDLRADEFDLVFKKTDSALRGPILAEVEAIMDSLGHRSAILVPQNPSRGRTIVGGQYHIDGIPLDQTSFAQDPHHPARTANVLELLGPSPTRTVRCLEPHEVAPPDGIVIAAARTIDDVRRSACLFAAESSTGVLPAGGGDFFQSILESRGLRAARPFITQLTGKRRLFVCGSASRDSLKLIARADRADIPICAMPDDLDTWHDQVLTSLETANAAVVFVGRPLDRSPGASQRIESALAQVVARVLDRQPIEQLFLEGGATASSVSRRMGWQTLEICGELSPGVVQMRATDGQTITVKPGSYPWPETVWV
ncbi:MAG: four-carbon acid sugar kinase family protein [Tepidisphaeraceae bacterium]